MLLRVLSAAIGIPLFLGIAWWGPVPFGIGVFILAAFGLGEMLATYRKCGFHPNPFLALLGLAVVAWPLAAAGKEPATSGFQAGTFTLGLIALLVAAPVWEVVRAVKTGEMTVARNLGYGAVCGGYTSLFACLTMLRMQTFGPDYMGFSNDSSWRGTLFVTILCVWATDTFAFLIGKTLGRHKLAPQVSPGKTIEGAIGGFVAALIVGAMAGRWFYGYPGTGLEIGAIAGIFGQVGDLFESGLKRELGVKDFGVILPGHGGVLDRFDSLLFVAPLVLLMFMSRQ